MINHGTRGGYYAHRRLKETPCAACRAAINEYVREYRAKTGLGRSRDREKIRRRALAALKKKHREEYDHLVVHFELVADIEAGEVDEQ